MKNFLVFILLVLSGLCYAEPLVAPKVNPEKPLEIRAEKVNMYRKKGKIHFIDNVRAKQGDMEIFSRKMVVDYSEKQNSKIEIFKIDVEGNARMFTRNIVATGNSGMYDFKKGLVSLKGDVIANEQGAMAYGDEFIYNVNTRKTKLLGNKKEDDRVIIILEDLEETKERVKGNEENEKNETSGTDKAE